MLYYIYTRMSLSQKIKEQVNNLLPEMKADTIDYAPILEKIKQIIIEDDPKPRTQAIRYSQIKKMFKAVTDNAEFLNQIKPPKELQDIVFEDDKKVRDNRTRIAITQPIVEQIMSYAFSEDPAKLFIYLLFVSGRRTQELYSSKFVNIKQSKDIQLIGITKRRDVNDNTCMFTPLIAKTRFFQIYKKYRKLRKVYSSQLTFQRHLDRLIKKEFPEHKFHPHVFRGMYVTYLFRFRNYQNLKINTFIKQHLHHQSINTSMNYTQYYVVPEFNKDIIAKLKGINPMEKHDGNLHQALNDGNLHQAS